MLAPFMIEPSDKSYTDVYKRQAVCRLLSTLAPLQDRLYEKLLADKPLEHDPVFILVHWRSGTTFVHNVFSCDKHFRLQHDIPDCISASHDVGAAFL